MEPESNLRRLQIKSDFPIHQSHEPRFALSVQAYLTSRPTTESPLGLKPEAVTSLKTGSYGSWIHGMIR